MSTRWHLVMATTDGGRGVAVFEHRCDDGVVDLVVQPESYGLHIMQARPGGSPAIPWNEVEDLVNAIRASENIARAHGWVSGSPVEKVDVAIAAIENNGHRFQPDGIGNWICCRCRSSTKGFPSLYADPCPGDSKPS